MLNFRKWMEDTGSLSEGTNPGAKTGLYPLGYGGIGLYPPAWYPTRSADAIFYMSIDERIYKGKEGGSFDITHLPGKSPESNTSGDRGHWDISHLPGKPSHPVGKNYAAKHGEGEPWSIKHMRGGKETSGPDFVPASGEGGVWDIRHIKESAADDILGMLSDELGLDPEDIINLNTNDLGSDLKDKIKGMGIIKSTNDEMGGLARIYRMIDDGITIGELADAIG